MKNEHIGKKLKELRVSRKLRQYEVAEAVGVSRAMISNLEAGRRSLTLETLKAFADYYKISLLKCSTVSSQLSRVETAIIDALEEHLENYKYFIENYADEIQKEEKANIKILAKVEKKIEKLNKEKRNALRNYNAEDITREEYLELKTDIEAELKELENQRIEIETSEQNDKLTQYQKAVPILSACINQYHTLGVAERNELLKSIIEKVIYSKTARVWKSQEDKNFRLEVFLRI